MKRKIISVLLTLVLVLSFSLVTAVPATAQSTLNVVPFSLINAGSGTAAWATAQAHSGTSSVLLDAGTLGGANAGRIQVEVAAIPMASFTGATFWVWEPTGTEHGGTEPNTDQIYPYGDPYINILIDTDGDGSFDEKMEGVGSITVGSTTSPATHPTPTAETWVQMEEGYGFYDFDDSLGSGIGQGPGGTGHPWDFGTLAEWKTWFASGAPQNTYTVVGVQITFGYWGPDVVPDVYVDDIAINGVTYYGLIGDAVDVAVDTDIISVGAGTYNAETTWPININHDLTVVSVAGAATTIINPGANGQGVIAITNDGVTLDGFTITHGTQTSSSSNPPENTIWVDAEYSTIKNNFITGAPGTAAIYIGGRTSPGDGYAMFLYGTGQPLGHTIQDNAIDCRNSGEGWGIFAVELTDSLIHGNSFTGSSDVGDGRATAWAATAGTPGTAIIIHSATAGTATGSPGGGNIVVEDNTASWVKYTFMNFTASVLIVDVNGVTYEKAVAGTVDDVIVRNNTVTNVGKNSTDYNSGNIVNFQAESKGYPVTKIGASLTIGSNKVTVGPGNSFQTADNIIRIKDPKFAVDTYYGVLDANNIVVIHNSLAGAQSYGIYNGTTHTDQDSDDLGGDAVIVALNNWWGNASGPVDATTAPTSYGDAVTASVTYEPWLLAAVVSGVTPTTYDKTLALKDGWTLVSTNKAVASTTSDAGTTSVLKYADESGTLVWGTVTVANLEPVDVLCIKTVGGGGVGINYAATQAGVSSKGLLAGWNLISSGTTPINSEPSAYDVLSPLPFATLGGAQAVGLTTLVSQGSYNQFSNGFYQATLQSSDWTDLQSITLVPYDGYWIQMNAASDFGVITD